MYYRKEGKKILYHQMWQVHNDCLKICVMNKEKK